MLATQGQHLSHSRRKLLSVHLFTQPFHKELPCTSCNQHVQDAKSSTVHETVPTLFFLKGACHITMLLLMVQDLRYFL